MSTRLLREKTLTSIHKGQLRAILAGAVHTCARMWARGKVITGLCPACGHEDLTHFCWNCKTEHTRHDERGNNAPACRDMMLVQKDTQLLDGERNNRTNEIGSRRC